MSSDLDSSLGYEYDMYELGIFVRNLYDVLFGHPGLEYLPLHRDG